MQVLFVLQYPNSSCRSLSPCWNVPQKERSLTSWLTGGLTARNNTTPLRRNPQNSRLPFDMRNATNLHSAADSSLAGISSTVTPQNQGTIVILALLPLPAHLFKSSISFYILSCAVFTYLDYRNDSSKEVIALSCLVRMTFSWHTAYPSCPEFWQHIVNVRGGKKNQQQNNPQKPNKRTPKPNQKQPNLPPPKKPHNPKKETTKKHADLLLKNPKALTSPNLNKHKTKKWYFRRFCRTLSMLSLIMFCLKVLHQNKIIFFKRQNVEKKRPT